MPGACCSLYSEAAPGRGGAVSVKRDKKGRRSPPLSSLPWRALAEQVLRDARRLIEEVARCHELGAQAVEIDIEQRALPFADFARDDHGFDVAAIHHLHDRSRHVIDREDVQVARIDRKSTRLNSS